MPSGDSRYLSPRCPNDQNTSPRLTGENENDRTRAMATCLQLHRKHVFFLPLLVALAAKEEDRYLLFVALQRLCVPHLVSVYILMAFVCVTPCLSMSLCRLLLQSASGVLLCVSASCQPDLRLSLSESLCFARLLCAYPFAIVYRVASLFESGSETMFAFCFSRFVFVFVAVVHFVCGFLAVLLRLFACLRFCLLRA